MLLAFLLLIPGSSKAQDDFDPGNPDEPQVPVFYYALTATCDPVEAGTASGRGNYAPGTSVTVTTSPRSGYRFRHWKLNGSVYSDQQRLTYTAVAGGMDFVAVYDLDPVEPAEPTMNVKSRLYLTSDPVDICTFNRASGAFADADDYVLVNVTGVDQCYEFTGWYLDGVKLTDEQDFNHAMGYHDQTLVALFRQVPFVPVNPGEPASQGEANIQTHPTGDANEDGAVDVSDAVSVINVFLSGDSARVNAALSDANDDGVIDITDAVVIINDFLNSN